MRTLRNILTSGIVCCSMLLTPAYVMAQHRNASGSSNRQQASQQQRSSSSSSRAAQSNGGSHARQAQSRNSTVQSQQSVNRQSNSGRSGNSNISTQPSVKNNVQRQLNTQPAVQQQSGSVNRSTQSMTQSALGGNYQPLEQRRQSNSRPQGSGNVNNRPQGGNQPQGGQRPQGGNPPQGVGNNFNNQQPSGGSSQQGNVRGSNTHRAAPGDSPVTTRPAQPQGGQQHQPQHHPQQPQRPVANPPRLPFQGNGTWNGRPIGRDNWGHAAPPPVRQFRPVRPIPVRPVIPATWRPIAGGHSIVSVFGLILGTAIYDASISHLYSYGYNVDGYANGVIYLHNVSEHGYHWDDSVLNYDDFGRLACVQFFFSTMYRDPSRFNRLSRHFVAEYGAPIARTGNTITWYGADGRGYVTLEYYYDAGRYYTALTYAY